MELDIYQRENVPQDARVNMCIIGVLKIQLAETLMTSVEFSFVLYRKVLLSSQWSFLWEQTACCFEGQGGRVKGSSSREEPQGSMIWAGEDTNLNSIFFQEVISKGPKLTWSVISKDPSTLPNCRHATWLGGSQWSQNLPLTGLLHSPFLSSLPLFLF